MPAAPPSPPPPAAQTPSAGQGPGEAQAERETPIQRQLPVASAAQLARSRWAAQGSPGTGSGLPTGVGQVHDDVGQAVPVGQTQETPPSGDDTAVSAGCRLTVCVVTVDGSPGLTAAGAPGSLHEHEQGGQVCPGAQIGQEQAQVPSSGQVASLTLMPVALPGPPHEQAQGRQLSPAAQSGQEQVQVPPGALAR